MIANDIDSIKDISVVCQEDDVRKDVSWPKNSPRSHGSRPKRRNLDNNYLLQPEFALNLFFEPTETSLWNESLRWRLEKVFYSTDDTSKALLFDFRNSLVVSKRSQLSAKSIYPDHVQLSDKCRDLRKQNVTVVKFNEDTGEKTIRVLKNPLRNKEKNKITLLQRPGRSTEDVVVSEVSKLKIKTPQISLESETEECLRLLERAGKNSDRADFKEATNKCLRALSLIYTCVIELVNSREDVSGFKFNILSKFASAFEKLFLKHQKEKALSPGSDGDHHTELLQTRFKIFALESLKLHDDFISKLRLIVEDRDWDFLLPRDLSSDRIGLIVLDEPEKKSNGKQSFDLISSFLYSDFMAHGYIHLSLAKTFRVKVRPPVESAFPSDFFTIYINFFVKASMIRPDKSSPFLAIKNSLDTNHIENNLLALYTYMRDDTNNRSMSLELRNLSRLYSLFYPIFAASYDDVFNANCRKRSPIKSSAKQRWLLPDGVNDPLFDPDTAKRLANNLHKYTFKGQELEFKYFFYWSGIRLLTFMGYKILNGLDLDSFEENVIIAMGGLTCGIATKMVDLSHLVHLSRFLISVATVCAGNIATDETRIRLRTAVRLIVEYCAVIVKQLNIILKATDLKQSILNGNIETEAIKFLIPTLILTYWMSRFSQFSEVAEWKRKWSLDTNLLADLWPEMETLGNTIGEIENELLYIKVEEKDNALIALIPELLNSYGSSPIFASNIPRFYLEMDERTTPSMDIQVDVRLFCLHDSLKKLAGLNDYFTYKNGRFRGVSDATRVLVPESEYIDLPSMLPVPLNEIIECVNRRRTEVPTEQAKELAELVELARGLEDAEEGEGIVKNIVIVIKPQYLVIDTNVFIDALPHVVELMKDMALTILIPTPVLSELRGLRNKTALPGDEKDERRAKVVSEGAQKTLDLFETITQSNVKVLLCNGVVDDFHPDYYERLDETNNDRLIIDCARKLSDRVSARSHYVPCGEIWLYRNVLLISKDRVMMLLAFGHRIPSLDIITFSRWAGFRKPSD
ncbi:unnamed protein product [Bursaphelenchus xylophilus]|uniref:(pine wood nematode) hypothetical protein n=1 Tax=Bursaphelenchus xylophilus TaxID=6326 RepID=A0A1I7SUG6_BURXY|nr:unnamed protein product [Bursaphelenchus xylophilus]CAG9107152.1 unnamed protein product [Bursaphelenchus xylophilus]